VTDTRPGFASPATSVQVKAGETAGIQPGLIDARVTVPAPVAEEVPRPALEALLDACAKHRLTIVSAGPGWGKTTAVAGWARRSLAGRAGATAWLTLGTGDDTPAVFWESFLRAMETSGAIPEGHPLSSVTTSGGVSEEVLLALFRGLRALPEPLLLILDDFHVIEHPAILEALANLVAHDTSVNLMLLTRQDPALPLHRLRLSGDLAEVRASDLAFDADAVLRLASRTESLHLSPEQVETFLVRTEGWPAGVRLATMYLSREHDDPTLEGFGGTERSVAEFLLAEVLARHDTGTTDFLLRTSVVEWLTGELADALVPGGHGLAGLEQLEQANTFVTCVDRERSVFRFHPLLRDLLMHRFRRDDAVGYREAHRAAARWLDGADEPVEAIGHAVAAEDWHLAGGIFFKAAPWLITGHRFRLAQHLRAIPYEKLPPAADLELCAAGAALVAGRYDALAGHMESARQLVRDGDVLPPLGSAVMEVLAAVAAREYGDPRRVMDAATATLEQLAQSPPSLAVEGLQPIAVHQRTVGYLMLTGDAASALEVFSAVADAQQGDTTLVSFNARVYQAWCLALAGRLDESATVAREVLREASVLGWSSSLHALPAHLARAMTHLHRAEGPDAYRAAMAALAATAGVTELWPTVALHLTRASIAVCRHRPRAALAYFENALATRGSRPVPRALADMWVRTHVDVALLVGDAAAMRPLEDAEPGARSATWWSSHARHALAHGDVEAAETAAERVSRSLPAEESTDEDLADVLAAIEACLVLGVVADRRRRPQESAAYIRSALDLARPQRLVQPFLATEPERIAFILQRALTDGVVVHPDAFVQEILPRLSPDGLAPPEPDPLIEPLTERELAVLAELPTWKSNAEIADEFYVSINTVKTHLHHLFRKLDVPNRRQAVRRARELGLIP
jgi:LuxR family transcriptional regulator, maltose regulon positive regulatory protein